MPTPAAGMMSSAVVTAITLRPPLIAIMKELGIRRVAPANPAMAGNVYSCAVENVKLRFSICTMMIDQYSQIANPASRHGMEMKRFRNAILLPVLRQNSALSTSHSVIAPRREAC